MLAYSPKYLVVLLLCFVPLVLHFRDRTAERYYRNQAPQMVSQLSQAGTQEDNNSTSFQHDGVFDGTAEGAPRIAQVSMQFGGNFDLVFERGLRTHIENGEKWGYPTHYLRQDIVGKGDIAQGVYDKLLYLQTVMVGEMTKPFGKRAEWLVWFDADTVLLNNNVPWTIFLPPTEGMFRDIHILIAKDWNGFNAGVFLIRVCEWSVDVLSDAIALPRLRPEIDLPLREQNALEWAFSQPQNLKHRIYQPKHWFNTYDEYYADQGEVVMKGCLLVHFPGMGDSRSDAMGHWLDKLDHSPEQLRVPLAETSYPSEIEAYWSALRRAADMLHNSHVFMDEVRKEESDISADGERRFAEKLAEAERKLQYVIQGEDPANKDHLGEAVSKLDQAIQEAKKDFSQLVKMQEEQAGNKTEEEEEQQQH
ncbi:MAG: hypothetical protein Q9163_003282 [Psora crenata]